MNETDIKNKSAKIFSLQPPSSDKKDSVNKPKDHHKRDDNSFRLSLNNLSSNFNALCAEESLTGLEQTSIRSLVAYNAYISGVNQEVIRSMVETRFGAQEIAAIRRQDYDDVIRFLVDLKANEAVN